MSIDMQELKTRLKATWMTGDYDRFARYMEGGARRFYETLAVPAGSRLLDVGCGAGQIALMAARAGVEATGCDIAVNWLEQARARAIREGLRVRFEEGDAEALPYADGEFDVVTSMVGAMFAPRPHLVAAELARVAKPGGMVAMANWTPGGFIGQMFKVIAKFIAPTGMPSPTLWGDAETVRFRFGDGMERVETREEIFLFEYPFGPEEVVEFYRENYGPMARAFAALDAGGQQTLRAELTRLWAAHNQAGNGGTQVASEYLRVVATKAKSGVLGRAETAAG